MPDGPLQEPGPQQGAASPRRGFWAAWDDPRIRSYPLLRTKLILAFICGGVFLGVAGYYIGIANHGPVLRVTSLVVPWVLLFPAFVWGVFENIKRLSTRRSETEED